MPLKDVSIREEVAKELDKGHGFWNIPKDTIVGFHRGLQKKYGAAELTRNSLQTHDPLAAAATNRLLGKKVAIAESNAQEAKSSAHASKNALKVISQNEHHQTSYLVSIDNTLKQMDRKMVEARQKGVRDEAQSKVHQIKREHNKMFPKRNRRQADHLKTKESVGKGPDLFSTIKNFLGENFTIGNMLKYGAVLASTGYDAYQGFSRPDDFGGGPLMGMLGALIGGTGQGGMTQGIKKMIDLGTIGGLLAGPVGALVGTILGAIGGYIGGKEVANFMRDALDRLLENVWNSNMHRLQSAVLKPFNAIGDALYDALTGVGDFLGDIGRQVMGIASNMLANVKESFGNHLKGMSKVPGLGWLSDIGDWWVNSAQKTRDEAAARDQETQQRQRESRSARDKKETEKRKIRDNKQTTKDTYHSMENVARRTIGMETRMDGTLLDDAKSKLGEAMDAANKMIPGGIPQLPSTDTPPPPAAKTDTPAPKVEKQDTSPKKVSDPNELIKADLSVGQVPGADIKAAAKAASEMPDKHGNTDMTVKPEYLATLVAKETSGQFSKTVGDGGKSLGIAHMGQSAIEDVNKAFGTQYTHDEIKKDYKKALLAAGLFFRLKLKQNDGNPRAAFKSWNGSGFAAENYSHDAMVKMSAIPAQPVPQQSNVAAIAPQVKTSGLKIDQGSRENKWIEVLQRFQQVQPQPMINQTNVNNKKTSVHTPDPATRNPEPTLITSIYGT
jgi:hypothetical protein